MSSFLVAIVALSPGLLAGGLSAIIGMWLSRYAGLSCLALFLGFVGYLAWPKSGGFYGYSYFQGPPPPLWITAMLSQVLPLNAVVSVLSYGACSFFFPTRGGNA